MKHILYFKIASSFEVLDCSFFTKTCIVSELELQLELQIPVHKSRTKPLSNLQVGTYCFQLLHQAHYTIRILLITSDKVQRLLTV